MNILKYKQIAFGVIAAAALGACQPDDNEGGNSLNNSATDASFTVTSIDANHFRLQGATNGASNRWNGALAGDAYTVFLPDAGDFDVTHMICGAGGICTSAVQSVHVETPDPIAGNIILGGKFLNQADWDQWTVLHISGTNTSWTFNDGSATIMGNSSNQQGIYQAVQLEGGHQYKVDMHVAGSGATNTWFEVYLSQTAPTQNADYSADGIKLGLNTWTGCGTSAFNGQLSAVGCVGSGSTVTVTNSGTYYLVIKSGGDNLGTTGITISNVELRRVS
jgi:hypothetical protein